MRIPKTPIKSRVICRKCDTVFQNTGSKTRTNCPNCQNVIDIRDRSASAKLYAKKHPERKEALKAYCKENSKEKGKRTRERLRNGILNLISNHTIKCVMCGCDKKEMLEINHKNGGGCQEVQNGRKTSTFYWNIYMGRRTVEDLELLCKVCNARHYLELKFGTLPYEIKWKP